MPHHPVPQGMVRKKRFRGCLVRYICVKRNRNGGDINGKEIYN
jgi:hypothetical protein